MKSRILVIGVALSASFGTVGCKKKADDGYLKQIESAATAMCKCSQVPADKTVTCLAGVPSPHPKAPGDEAPGLYEESLTEEDRAVIDRLRAQYQSCETAIFARR